MDRDERFTRLVDEVARQIVTTEHFGTSSVIKTPLIYPSGASVTVQLSQQLDRYFVSDMGFGFEEASMIGAGTYYSRSAKALAERFGIRFDNQAFFVAEATRDQLAAATTIVANCSSEAAAIAAYRSAERRYLEDADVLYNRLITVFPKREVERDVDFVGSSNHAWPIAAIVHHNDNVAIFEPVSKYHLSVVNAVAKFHDIARLEAPPRRIAVVKRKADMGDLLNVLSQAATVIEYEASNDQISRVAEAA